MSLTFLQASIVALVPLMLHSQGRRAALHDLRALRRAHRRGGGHRSPAGAGADAGAEGRAGDRGQGRVKGGASCTGNCRLQRQYLYCGAVCTICTALTEGASQFAWDRARACRCSERW